MALRLALLASVSLALSATAASAQTVNDTDLPDVNGTYGAGVATTVTTPNGTTTTVVGPGGSANRATAPVTTGNWFQANVGANGTVGITNTYSNDGNGAAYFNSTSADSKADLQYYFAGGPVALSSLNSMSFDFYRDPASTTGDLFAPSLRLDILEDGLFAGSLVLEFYYQDQQNAPEGAWTNVSATLNDGIFWATNARLGPTFAAADGGQKTLAEWIAGNAGSDLTVYGLSTGVGSGWSGAFSGAVDHIAVDFAGGPSANFDFAVNQAAAVPEPASWAMMISGFGLVGGAMRRRGARLVAA